MPPLAPPFVLDNTTWAPNLCMLVPGLCSSVFYVKWASFGCVTQQRCFVYLCCVFCVFSCYSRLVSLQSIIHQNSWNSLVITPITTVDVHFSCLYAGVDGINFGLNSHQHPCKGGGQMAALPGRPDKGRPASPTLQSLTPRLRVEDKHTDLTCL